MRTKLAILAAALLCACCGPSEVDAVAERARYEFVKNDSQGSDDLLHNARRADGERCARRIVALKVQALAGKDVAQDLRAIEATAATIAQRAQLKGADAVDRVVRSVLTNLVSAVLGAMG